MNSIFRVGSTALEVESNDSTSTANTTESPVLIDGSLTAGEYDYFLVENSTSSTQSFGFVTFRPIGGTSFDSYLRLYDEFGLSLTSNDDSSEGLYSRISYSLLPGSSYYIAVYGYSTSSTGDYILAIYGPPGVVTGTPGTGGGVTVIIQ